jgi:hypothetical protein
MIWDDNNPVCWPSEPYWKKGTKTTQFNAESSRFRRVFPWTKLIRQRDELLNICWSQGTLLSKLTQPWQVGGYWSYPQNCASLSKALCKSKMIRVQERSLLWFEYLSINIYLSLPLRRSLSCVLFTASCITIYIYIHILFPHLYLHVIWVFTELWQGWNPPKIEFFLFINK